jgi:hypothetical protein
MGNSPLFYRENYEKHMDTVWAEFFNVRAGHTVIALL